MITALKNNPLVRRIFRYLAEPSYRKHFAGDGYGCFWGVFESFEEALQSAPATKPIGYDNPELALEYQSQVETEGSWEGSTRSASCAQPYDYPILFWLNSIFESGLSNPNVFDFGGNVGIHFYAYEKYIRYPSHLVWTVCDVPEIVRAGKDLVERRSRSNLIFTCNPQDMRGKDIFLASGSIHYAKDFSFLSTFGRPQHILLNRVPIHDGDRFVTLQNGGKVFYPQYVFNKHEFINYFLENEYEMIDSWEDRATSCMIPFYPDHSVPCCNGFYFKAISP